MLGDKPERRFKARVSYSCEVVGDDAVDALKNLSYAVESSWTRNHSPIRAEIIGEVFNMPTPPPEGMEKEVAAALAPGVSVDVVPEPHALEEPNPNPCTEPLY